jgi:putative ABC transport system ATP-binding protein
MLIETRELNKTYNMGGIPTQALRGVSIGVEEGEFVAIMGASGSGKSTLMHLLGCLDRPTRGTYRLDGVEVGTLNDNQLSRLRNEKIGFVFQAFNLILQNNVLENVELPMVYNGVAKSIRRERSLAMLERVGLGHRVLHRPTELSGGEVQRVAVARALAFQPPVLFADEPTGNLDSKTSVEIMKLFVDLNQHGTTIVLVTHSRDIANYATRLIEMKDGLVKFDSKHDSSILEPAE